MHTAIAILIANLPQRWWSVFDDRFAVSRHAWMAGVLTMIAGTLLGVHGFLVYVGIAADGLNIGLLRAQSDLVQLQGPLLLALPAFLFASPVGLLSLYLSISGLVRFAAAFIIDDPHGDWVLTGIDSLARRAHRRTSDWDARRTRERREGVQIPDRLLTGALLDRPDIQLAVIASRRKDWPRGAYLVTPAGIAYRVGDAFDLETRHGLRTVYPLTELTTGEAIRHAIPYELPAEWRQPVR
jgi:hypothetical protein